MDSGSWHLAWLMTLPEEPPYQVTTDDVEDVFDATERETASGKTKKTYKMISMCNKNNRFSLMLAPTHGKHVFALAVITSIHGDTLYAENVASLHRDEKDQLAKAIRQEMTLATRLMHHTTSGNNTPWTGTTSPLASSKCRTLGRSPTGQELEALHMSIAKNNTNRVSERLAPRDRAHSQ